MTGLAVGLTGMVSALRPFGTVHTRPLFWRESAAGINRVAYFFAVMVGQIPAMLILPVFFLSLYYSLTAPRASFGSFYTIFLFTYWATFGIGYVLSTAVHPDNSKMAGVVIGLIASVVSGSSTTTICKLDKYTFIGPLMYSVAYSKWFSEGLFESEANQYPPVLSYDVQLLAGLNDYSLNNFGTVLAALFGIGAVCRAVALFLLLFTHRGEQKWGGIEFTRSELLHMLIYFTSARTKTLIKLAVRLVQLTKLLKIFDFWAWYVDIFYQCKYTNLLSS